VVKQTLSTSRIGDKRQERSNKKLILFISKNNNDKPSKKECHLSLIHPARRSPASAKFALVESISFVNLFGLAALLWKAILVVLFFDCMLYESTH
jgi:hypothetical protein